MAEFRLTISGAQLSEACNALVVAEAGMGAKPGPFAQPPKAVGKPCPAVLLAALANAVPPGSPTTSCTNPVVLVIVKACA